MLECCPAALHSSRQCSVLPYNRHGTTAFPEWQNGHCFQHARHTVVKDGGKFGRRCVYILRVPKELQDSKPLKQAVVGKGMIVGIFSPSHRLLPNSTSPTYCRGIMQPDSAALLYVLVLAEAERDANKVVKRWQLQRSTPGLALHIDCGSVKSRANIKPEEEPEMEMMDLVDAWRMAETESPVAAHGTATGSPGAITRSTWASLESRFNKTPLDKLVGPISKKSPRLGARAAAAAAGAAKPPRNLERALSGGG